ncbi:MAG: DUF1549 and DUF1553 domain-containing protein [Planctomycetaceae bacterium]
MRFWLIFVMVFCPLPAGRVSASDVVKPASEYTEPQFTEADRSHWSFQPRTDPAIPSNAVADWVRNPIDAFIGAELQNRGLYPALQADRRTLIRRAALDLTGLLPDQSAEDMFLNDRTSGADERMISRLLDSFAYGERSAQHWLDLARFAETDGFEHDKVRPDAWRYRDWVIQAFHDNLPYDRFVQLQLAGDLLIPEDPAARIATHFCLCGPDMPDINLQEERRHTLLNDITATVAETILGLQFGCAQCHDHKYDPISQADFYRLRAVFEPAVVLKKNVSVNHLQIRSADVVDSYVMLRGDFQRPGPTVRPRIPQALVPSGGNDPLLSASGPGAQRLALAKWLTSPENPLAARVVVNRIWQQHFGIGLCESPGDFGVMGHAPTHPDLLDWLATWFVDHQQNLKQLHLLILTSATWQQQSRLPDTADSLQQTHWKQSLQEDPEARWLSRFPRRRLQGEVIRDVMLQCSGLLNRKSGGPGIRPPLPTELRRTLLKDQWKVTESEDEHLRRSIYVFARRNLRYPIFEVFDRPAAIQSCAQRTVSITAPQSLHLLNSEFSLKVAEAAAQQLTSGHPDNHQLAAAAFEKILRRKADTDELQDAADFLQQCGNAGTFSCHFSVPGSLLNSNRIHFVD